MKKINNKGFTLTELLATIAILALVAVIATPAVIGVSNSIKKNMFESKKKLLLQAAKLYGEDNDVENNNEIKVNVLIDNNYITCDDNESATDCIVNPKNNLSMKECVIKYTVNNGRVIAKWISNTDNCKYE